MPHSNVPIFLLKKHVFFLQKHVFSTKNGLIKVGLMSVKQLNKERPPLEILVKCPTPSFVIFVSDRSLSPQNFRYDVLYPLYSVYLFSLVVVFESIK